MNRKSAIGVFKDEVIEQKSEKPAECSTQDQVLPMSSTLRRSIDKSEERIVLRRTDSGNKRKLSDFAGSKTQFPSDGNNINSAPGADNDNESLTTTTSDVNSDDDAASIVSRLSQIVVEQEEKLMTLFGRPQQGELTLNRSRSSSQFAATRNNLFTTGPNRSNSNTNINSDLTTNSNNNLDTETETGKVNRLRFDMVKRKSLADQQNVPREFERSISASANKMCQQHEEIKLKNEPDNDDSDDDDDERDNYIVGRINENNHDTIGNIASFNVKNSFKDSIQNLPEIYVIKDNGSGRQTSQSGESRKFGAKRRRSTRQPAGSVRKTRAKSVADVIVEAKQNLRPPFMRRNESSGMLPERGDLRELENSRNSSSNMLNEIVKKNNIGRDSNMPVSKFKLQASSLEQVSNNNPTQQPRLRSNTAGSIQKPALMNRSIASDESILNIRRSAWTLSEFDQTYNGSCSALNKSMSDLSESQQQVFVSLNKAENGEKPVLMKEAKNNKAEGEKLVQSNSVGARLSSMALTNTRSEIGNGKLDSSKDLKIQSTTREVNGHFVEQQVRRASYAQSLCSADSFSFNRDFAIVGNNKKLVPDGSRYEQATTGTTFPSSFPCFRPCFFQNIIKLSHRFPIIDWLPNYNLNFLWGDLTAGIAVAVLNISTSLSAAVVAGTDFGVAFRASIVSTFVYAILCSSRHTSFGSWSIMSQMLLVSVNRALSDELILTRLNTGPPAYWEPEEYEKWHLNIIIMYTFLIGLIQLICGLLNLGNILASFIPEALCSSLITATAFTMAVGQLANMAGTSNRILFSIEKNTTELWADLKNPPVDISDLFSGLFRWIKQIALLVEYNEQINLVCVTISIVSVILLFLNQYVLQTQLERLFKRKILVPSEMILLVLMVILSNLVGLKENYQVTTCGPINVDFVVPDVPNLKLIRELWFESVATALISYTMVYVMAKTYSNKFNYDVDCNQELIACGAGNLVGGLFEALPATASFSRTAGQVEAGGQTQMASIINCVVLVVLAKACGKYVAELPICVMAATLFYGFVRMMTRFREVFKYWRVCKVDFAIWMVTFVAILTLDIVNGFVYGFIFSILTILYRAQK